MSATGGAASGRWVSLGQGPILHPRPLTECWAKFKFLPFSLLSAGAFPGLLRQARAAASAAFRGSAGARGASGRWVSLGQGPILHPRPLAECWAIFKFCPLSRLSAGAVPGLVRQARVPTSAAFRGSAGSRGASGRWVFLGLGPFSHTRPLTMCWAKFQFCLFCASAPAHLLG